jgi:uncharacterized protein YqjF (DUF2071 family)
MAHTTDLDRVSPTIEPSSPPVMRQDWHHLLFLHWAVDPLALRPLVPEPLALDLYEGRAWVGLVPFTVTGARAVLMPPLPLVSSFHEVNVRTYVHHGGRDPGVWFFSLDASSPLAVAAARALFHLNYLDAAIRFELAREEPPIVDLDARRTGEGGRPAHLRVRYAPQGPPAPAAFRSLDFFLVERYVLYARQGEKLWRGRVHHPAYRLQHVALEGLEETYLAATGIERPPGPVVAHYARGVDVKVYPLERCE